MTKKILAAVSAVALSMMLFSSPAHAATPRKFDCSVGVVPSVVGMRPKLADYRLRKAGFQFIRHYEQVRVADQIPRARSIVSRCLPVTLR